MRSLTVWVFLSLPGLQCFFIWLDRLIYWMRSLRDRNLQVCRHQEKHTAGSCKPRDPDTLNSSLYSNTWQKLTNIYVYILWLTAHSTQINTLRNKAIRWYASLQTKKTGHLRVHFCVCVCVSVCVCVGLQQCWCVSDYVYSSVQVCLCVSFQVCVCVCVCVGL